MNWGETDGQAALDAEVIISYMDSNNAACQHSSSEHTVAHGILRTHAQWYSQLPDCLHGHKQLKDGIYHGHSACLYLTQLSLPYPCSSHSPTEQVRKGSRTRVQLEVKHTKEEEEEEGVYILASQQGCVDVLKRTFPHQKH